MLLKTLIDAGRANFTSGLSPMTSGNHKAIQWPSNSLPHPKLGPQPFTQKKISLTQAIFKQLGLTQAILNKLHLTQAI